jgi:serine/threonine-protein phosphatase 2B regulatory subunit
LPLFSLQISFQEFRALVLDPDPARDDFRVSGTGETEQQEVQDRKKEAEDRNAKKLLLEDFVHENELGSAELGLITERYHRLAPSSDMLITFEQWVEVLDVEATGQYRKLFKLYVASPPGHLPEKLDMKEFLLGISNFVEGLSHEQKARFIFDLYDDDRSGFLSIAELVEVLKANHMQSAKAVLKKAQTIMKQVDADDSGTLSLEEFQVMAKKFPNLLFPKHQKEGQDKNASSNTPRE